MFNERNMLLEWDQNFISNNIDLTINPGETIYKTLNDKVFIFSKFAVPKIPLGYKHNIYQFIIDEFVLENNVNCGFCYFWKRDKSLPRKEFILFANSYFFKILVV